MQGHPEVLSAMQAQLKLELTAINQYYMHYRLFSHWGFGELGERAYKESIRKMKHSDRIMDRILILDGLPNLQDLGKLYVGEDVPEAIASDLKAEETSRENLQKAIAIAERERDYVTRELLHKLLDDTEEYLDFLQTQLDLIEKVGIQNYLQSCMDEAE